MILTVDQLAVGASIAMHHLHHSWRLIRGSLILQCNLDSDSDDLSEMIGCDLGDVAVAANDDAAGCDGHLGVSGAHHLDDAGDNQA